MKKYELSLKVFLLKNILHKETLTEISSLIDSSFLNSNEMSKFHKENNFKNYVFNSFFPVEQELYKEGNIYTIKIRVLGSELSDFFRKNLIGLRTDALQSLTIESKELKEKHIQTIYSITPAVCKFEDGYWKNNETIETFEKRIKENAIKKYNYFYNTKLDEDFPFIKNIKFLNRLPISTPYKNVNLLGDKIEIELEENEFAQKLGQIILSCGLLELNARGFGYMNGKFI